MRELLPSFPGTITVSLESYPVGRQEETWRPPGKIQITLLRSLLGLDRVTRAQIR